MKSFRIAAALRANPSMAVVGLSSFVGVLASSFFGLYLAVSFAEEGFSAVVVYLESWLAPAGFILFPAFFTLMRKTSPRSVAYAVFACQITGVILILVFKGRMSPCATGLIVALFSTGFSQMHHLALAQTTSHEFRALELSFLGGLSRLASLIGAAAGALMSSMPGTLPVYAAFLLQGAATFGLAMTLPRGRDQTAPSAEDVDFQGFRAGLRAYPRQNVGMALDAVHELVAVWLLTAWLVTSAFPIPLYGIFRAVGLVAGVIAAPFCATLVERGRGREFTLAAAAGVTGWTAVLLYPSPVVTMGANFLWATGVMLLNTGLQSRWYARRSPAQILIRELVLTTVRIPGIVAVAWIATVHALSRHGNCHLASGSAVRNVSASLGAGISDPVMVQAKGPMINRHGNGRRFSVPRPC